MPLETMHLRGDAMTWWCIGDREEIASLLRGCIGYLGKRRAVGHGPIARWEVEPCETWEGFPVVRAGRPLRPLPLDWPGLASEPETAYRVLAPPYWRRNREELCAVPAWT